MKLNYISTLALNNSLRSSTIQKQVDLSNAQIEVSTGRHADIGRELGAFTSNTISFERRIMLIEQTEITNSLTSNRIAAMQISLGSTIDVANEFIGQLTTEISGSLDTSLLQTIGDSTLGSIHSNLNITYKGDYAFSGLNSDSKALFDYNGSDGAAAKTAVETAFTATFGFATTDPLAETITPTDLENFIDGAFSDLFDDANWSSLWSGASERGVRSKISPNEFVQNDTTALNQGFREVTAATVLISEFSSVQLNSSTLDRLVEKSVEMMAESIGTLGNEQSKMGVIEGRISAANDQMEFQKTILSEQLNDLTAVDPYDAALRLNQISTSLEASYSLTARIQGLSLLNFI